MHSAFNLLVFPNSMFNPLLFLFIDRAMCSSEKSHLKITIIIIIICHQFDEHNPVRRCFRLRCETPVFSESHRLEEVKRWHSPVSSR